MLTPYLKVWKNTHFVPVTLKQLGLRIQLGHRPLEQCSNPRCMPNNDFTVLHINGFHSVNLNYCNCEIAKPRYVQLLRYGLWPGSVTFPETAATFSTLKFFHILNFESKTSHFKFYSTLVRLSNNTGLFVPKVRKWGPKFQYLMPHLGLLSFFSHHRPWISAY